MAKQYWRPGNMLYPVPAVMVSCGLPDEKPNIITIAWAGTVCSSPAMVSINLVTKDLVRAADYCGVRSGRDVDKFAEMHLTPFPSRTIATPGIAESPVNIECKVTEIKELGSHDLFLAEVTNVTIEDKYLNEQGKFELNQAGLITYSHGEYFILGEKAGSFGYSVRKKSSGQKNKGKKRSTCGKGKNTKNYSEGNSR